MKTTFFGLTSYQSSFGVQVQALHVVKQSGFPVVMGFEFYPVLVRGARGSEQDISVESRQVLAAQGLQMARSEFDFKFDLHSPGRLMICPLVPIEKLQISLKDLLQALETATVHWLEKYRIPSRVTELGIVTERGLIARVDGSAQSGLAQVQVALHISDDLSMYEKPELLGLGFNKQDSLEQRGVHLDLRQAFEEWNLYFANALLSAIPGSPDRH